VRRTDAGRAASSAGDLEDTSLEGDDRLASAVALSAASFISERQFEASASTAKHSSAARVRVVEGGGLVAYKQGLGRIDLHHRNPHSARTGTMSVFRFRKRLATVALVVVAAPLLIALRFGDPDGKTIDWPIPEFHEPSGIVYHPQRDSLFIVGDEGDIGEVSTDGKLLRQFHLGGDLEGVTVDPKTGLLYVVREGHEVIFEVRPDNFKLVRRFTIDRSFEGDPNFLRRGGDGIEGLTFVPDDDHPEGGRLWAVNQFDPPVLIELAIALRTSKEKFQVARIVRAVPVDLAPLSEVTWDAARREFLVASALWKRVVVLDAEGRTKRSVRIPAFMAEGMATLPGGEIVIAQDSGGVVLWKPEGDPFSAAAALPAPVSSHRESGPSAEPPVAARTSKSTATTEPASARSR
jgi:uncharacterized protein YjiK